MKALRCVSSQYDIIKNLDPILMASFIHGLFLFIFTTINLPARVEPGHLAHSFLPASDSASRSQELLWRKDRHLFCVSRVLHRNAVDCGSGWLSLLHLRFVINGK